MQLLGETPHMVCTSFQFAVVGTFHSKRGQTPLTCLVATLPSTALLPAASVNTETGTSSVRGCANMARCAHSGVQAQEERGMEVLSTEQLITLSSVLVAHFPIEIAAL